MVARWAVHDCGWFAFDRKMGFLMDTTWIDYVCKMGCLWLQDGFFVREKGAFYQAMEIAVVCITRWPSSDNILSGWQMCTVNNLTCCTSAYRYGLKNDKYSTSFGLLSRWRLKFALRREDGQWVCVGLSVVVCHSENFFSVGLYICLHSSLPMVRMFELRSFVHVNFHTLGGSCRKL